MESTWPITAGYFAGIEMFIKNRLDLNVTKETKSRQLLGGLHAAIERGDTVAVRAALELVNGVLSKNRNARQSLLDWGFTESLYF